MRRFHVSAVALITLLVITSGGGQAVAKAPGENGRVVFGEYDPAIDDSHLFTADPDGGGRVALLERAAFCPRWSPDGEEILVCVAGPTGLARPATVNANGTGLHILNNPDPTLNIACLAWSPDGARLACETWDDAHPARRGIYTVRASDGGGLQRLTRNQDAPMDYSPDGRRLLFFHFDDAEAATLFVMNVDGSGVRQLVQGQVSDDGASWSPDGKQILFTNRGRLWTIRPNGTGLAQIPVDDGPGLSYVHSVGSWSPDGERILFTMFLKAAGYQQDLFSVRSDGTDLVQLTHTPADEAVSDWGPVATG